MAEALKLDFEQAVAAFDAHVAANEYTQGPRPDQASSERTHEDDGWILRCFHPRWPGWQGTVYDKGAVVTAADAGPFHSIVTDPREVEMLRVLRCAPWADSLRWIADMEATLALLEAATASDSGEDSFCGDDGSPPVQAKVSLSPEAVAPLVQREQMRHVGRLVRILRLQYGDGNRSIKPWQVGGFACLLDRCQPADLLRLLADSYR